MRRSPAWPIASCALPTVGSPASTSRPVNLRVLPAVTVLATFRSVAIGALPTVATGPKLKSWISTLEKLTSAVLERWTEAAVTGGGGRETGPMSDVHQCPFCELRFTNLNAADLTLSRAGTNLQVRVNATGETITVDEHFWSQTSNWGIERMQFADGTSWDLAAINANAWLRGTGENDTVAGTSWNDTLLGDGGNDTLTGDAGGDRFVFGLNFGKDVITDFAAGVSGTDVIEFASSMFANFADVQAGMTQVGTATVITHGATNTITLNGVAPSALDADDFRFV